MTRTSVVRTLWLLLLWMLLAIASGVFAPIRLNAAENARAATLTFGGIERQYKLYRPAALKRDVPVPLVLVLHGGFGNGANAEASLHWDRSADAHGFVVLYPDGIARAWNAGACCGQPMQRQIDDTGFLTALAEQTIRDENIDPHRVYATGISNGAMMAYRLACEAPLAFAAIGPVAGTFSKACEHPKPTSVLAIHGLDDRRVPFKGGIGIGVDKSSRPPVEDVIAQWRTVDRCGTVRTHDAGPVHDETSSCADGRAVELITVAGAGHQWPGAEPPPPIAVKVLGLEQPSHALDATAVLWEFFAAHHS
jgi:polyhydroxybutyrate depolymerase